MYQIIITGQNLILQEINMIHISSCVVMKITNKKENEQNE